MKRLLLIIIILLIGISGWAQDDASILPDSLTSQLKEFRQNDDKRAQILIDLIEYCFDHRQHEAALPYIKELRNLKYYTEGDYYQIALCDYYYGNSMLKKNKKDNNTIGLQEAMQWFDKSLVSLDKTINNSSTMKLRARLMLNKSSCFFSMNLFPQMYECIINGIEFAEKENDSLMLGKLYNNLGLMYQNMFRNEESIVALKKSLVYFPNSILSLTNIAVTYTTVKEYDSAYIYLNYAMKNACNFNDSLSVYLWNGYTKRHEGNNEQGEMLLKEVVAGYERLSENNHEKCMAYRELAIAEEQLGKYTEALCSINEAIRIAEITQDLNALYFSYGVKSKVEKAMGDYESALLDVYNLMRIDDSLCQLRNANKIVQYERELEYKKAEENFRYESFKAQQKHKTTTIVSTITTVFIVVVAAFLVVLSRKRRKMLELELNAQHREMTSKALNQMHVNEVLGDVVDKLSKIQDSSNGEGASLSATIHDLKEMVDDGSKKDFDYYFVQVHPDFYKHLSADFPDLTPNDLRLCAFVIAKLNIKEIADLNNMSADSVKNARSRLRKKLGLTDPNASLLAFLSKY